MLEMICSIPSHIGWMIVGAVGMLTLEMYGLLISTVVKMVRERIIDEDEESEVC